MVNSFIPFFDLSPIYPASVEFILIVHVVKLNPNCNIMDDVRKAKVRGKNQTRDKNNNTKMANVDGKPSVAFAEI